MSAKHPMPAPRCAAKAKQTGKQCGRSAIPGGTVCRYHGGAAPQVMRKAQERIQALVFPAITGLGQMVRDKKHPTRLGAIKDVLDRAGLKPKDQIVVDGDVTFTLTFDRRRAEAPDAA